MSSANRLILISLFPILIPFILGLFLILNARISIVIQNKYADGGHPCLTPCSSLKNVPQKPLLRTLDSILSFKV
jgi:hypothetical protein